MNTNHDEFAKAALDFRATLERHGFGPPEIAAMLGSLVLASYTQTMRASYPPELHEMMTKINRINDRALAED